MVSQNPVQNMCKSTLKSMCESNVKTCSFLKLLIFPVQIFCSPQTFPVFSTKLPTTPSPPIFNNFIHFSTDTTTTIINNFIERI